LGLRKQPNQREHPSTTTVFKRLMDLPRGHRLRRELSTGQGGHHGEASELEAELSSVRVHHQCPLRHPPGVLVLAAPGPRAVASRGASHPPPDRLPDPWSSHRGGPLRPQWLPLHPGLRGPGRVVGDHHGQDRPLPAGARRLGHHRANHRAGDGNRV
jgi:hypothetical protein